METTSTHEVLARMLVEEFNVDPDAVDTLATFEELDVDSLDMVELGLLVEESLDVVLDESDVAEATTFGHIVDLIEAKLDGAGSVA